MNTGNIAKAAVACLEDDAAGQSRLDRGEHVISVNRKDLRGQDCRNSTREWPGVRRASSEQAQRPTAIRCR